MQNLIALILSFAVLCTLQQSCKDFSGKEIITRHWLLRPNATFTTAQVVTEFQTGFGPTVSALTGFREYVGTAVNATTNFFFNVFDTLQQASSAQTSAASFVANGALAAQIQQHRFFQGTYVFHIVAQSSCASSNQNYYLATRLWVLQANATYTTAQVATEFQNNFGPNISSQAGFREYAGLTVASPFGNHIFFYNVFSTLAQSQSANSLAASFVANGVLNDQIERVEFLTMQISFDILPPVASTSTTEAVPSSAALQTISVAVLFCFVTIALSLLGM